MRAIPVPYNSHVRKRPIGVISCKLQSLDQLLSRLRGRMAALWELTCTGVRNSSDAGGNVFSGLLPRWSIAILQWLLLCLDCDIASLAN
jgi:hypothetical protein